MNVIAVLVLLIHCGVETAAKPVAMFVTRMAQIPTTLIAQVANVNIATGADSIVMYVLWMMSV